MEQEKSIYELAKERGLCDKCDYLEICESQTNKICLAISMTSLFGTNKEEN